MKAIRIHEHGSEEKLIIDDIPEPRPQGKEVKVAVKVSALNHMDLWVRNGIPGIGALPLILGCDASGIVTEVGKEVTHIKAGQRVLIYPVLSCGLCQACQAGFENHCSRMQLFGEHVNGMHCEFVCVPEKNIVPIQDHVKFEEAAAFPLVFLTAWHMVVTNGCVKAGEDVLVIGGSSGVGSAAIQIAKMHGARVIATAGNSAKLALARQLGADEVINHYEESISQQVRALTNKQGVSLIVEHVGEKVWSECLKSLKWEGRLVTCGATTGPVISMDLRHLFIKQQRIIGSTMGSLSEMMLLNDYVAQARLKPLIGKVFPYLQVVQAHQFLEKENGYGKVVLTW